MSIMKKGLIMVNYCIDCVGMEIKCEVNEILCFWVNDLCV